MSLFPGAIYGGISQLGASANVAAAPWYLAGGVSPAILLDAWTWKGAASLAAAKVGANGGQCFAPAGSTDFTLTANGLESTVGAKNGWLIPYALNTIKSVIVKAYIPYSATYTLAIFCNGINGFQPRTIAAQGYMAFVNNISKATRSTTFGYHVFCITGRKFMYDGVQSGTDYAVDFASGNYFAINGNGKSKTEIDGWFNGNAVYTCMALYSDSILTQLPQIIAAIELL